jgi:hypothetical protein
MTSPHDDYARSIRQARKARRRGDPAEAERYTRIAERHLRMAGRLAELKSPFLKPLWTPSMTEEQQKAEARAKLDELLRRMDAEGVGQFPQDVPQDGCD